MLNFTIIAYPALGLATIDLSAFGGLQIATACFGPCYN